MMVSLFRNISKGILRVWLNVCNTVGLWGLEHQSHNQGVVGSSPTGTTKKTRALQMCL